MAFLIWQVKNGPFLKIFERIFAFIDCEGQNWYNRCNRKYVISDDQRRTVCLLEDILNWNN